MHKIIELILKELDVFVFPGVTFDSDKFTLEEFHKRYDDAFLADISQHIVVAIEPMPGKIFILGSVQQLWDNRQKFASPGIKKVFRMPRDKWEQILPSLDASHIHDLTVVIT